MIRGDVRGGTNSEGVSDEAFSMSMGMRIRYDRPDIRVAEYVTGYAVYAADASDLMINWHLPAPAMISVLIDAGPVSAAIRNHRFGPLDQVSLFGPTSRAIQTKATGGIAVGIGISALGWSRLTNRPASDFHNRIIPLSAVTGLPLVRYLLEGLTALRDDTAIKPFLDDALVPLFQGQYPNDLILRALTVLSATDDGIGTKDIASHLGLGRDRLTNVAKRYFGMPPKLLARRERFLRSFIRLLSKDGISQYSKLDSSYYDASHFLRDADTFLGTTPKRFLTSDMTFLKASLRARTAVLGQPTQALQI